MPRTRITISVAIYEEDNPALFKKLRSFGDEPRGAITRWIVKALENEMTKEAKSA